MSEVYKDCIGISTNGTRPQNVVDFSTKGGENCKTYIKLPDCIKEKESLEIFSNYKKYYDDCTMEEILQDTYLDYCAYKNTLKQLQAHKEKEDKLREYIKDSKFIYDIGVSDYIDYLLDADELLQILDGSDE